MGHAIFGKYRLIAELGHGGMADVFLAVVEGPAGSGFSKLTVVKRLRANLAEEPEFVDMLVDEARISARLNHPNVVQTNEVGSVGNQYFLAMEYLDGQPLHRIQHRATRKAKADAEAADAAVTAEPFPKECHYLVLADALAGLHYAHQLTDYDGSPLEIVHRDVTPHNIFVTYEGQTKVVDFGIAKAANRAAETRQGVVKGKVRYMAPEQAIGQRVDRRADVFSVGVMLWEAATGKRLWQGMDDLNIVQVLVAGQIKASPRSVVPTVPEAIDAMCRKALATDPAERYATAEEFRLDLEQYLAETGQLVPARRKLSLAVSELFHDKRAEIKGIIEKQIAALRNSAKTSEVSLVQASFDSQLSLESLGATTPVPGSSSSGVAVASQNASPTSLTNAATELYSGSKAAKPFSRFGLIVAGGVFVAAVTAVALTRTQSTTANGEHTTPPSATTMAPVPTEVKVKLSATPASAKLLLDGRLVDSPYEARLPRDTLEHTVRVEAPGFDPQVEKIRFDSDVTMVFNLTKTTAVSSAAATNNTTRTAKPTWPPPQPPQPATKPTATAPTTPHDPPPPSAAPTHAPAPTAPPANKAPKPDIDKGDPWGNNPR